jgi:hypothetical protein
MSASTKRRKRRVKRSREHEDCQRRVGRAGPFGRAFLHMLGQPSHVDMHEHNRNTPAYAFR